MNHFSAIGFSVKTQDDYSQLIEQILAVAKPHSTHEALSYLRYIDASGAEIWLCGDNQKRQIVAATPCFLPTITKTVGVNQVTPKGDGQYGDGKAHGWINAHEYDKDEGWDDGDYPVIIDLPDYLNHQPSSQIMSGYLTLFAQNVEWYVDLEDFNDSQEEDGSNLNAEFFSPDGMLLDESEEVFGNPPMSTATVLAGLTVITAEKRYNALTGMPFIWCHGHTYGGEYEAVYPFAMLDMVGLPLPKPGNIIFGDYWLTGRFAP